MSLKVKMLSQTTAKMTIALVATCILFVSRGHAEKICVITSKHLARLGGKANSFFQMIDEKVNMAEFAQSIRLNEVAYDFDDVLIFSTPIYWNDLSELPDDTQSEIAGLITSLGQFDYENNGPFICDGESFDSSSRKHQITSLLEHAHFSQIITRFYMDEYYTK